MDLLHVDNGLMRKDESAQVLEFFAGLGLGSHVHFVDASDRFLEALEGLIDPEEKRWAIGNTFIDVFRDQASHPGIDGHLLGQATTYPDTIETGGTQRADTIKTHHNRVPIIKEMIERHQPDIEIWPSHYFIPEICNILQLILDETFSQEIFILNMNLLRLFAI